MLDRTIVMALWLAVLSIPAIGQTASPSPPPDKAEENIRQIRRDREQRNMAEARAMPSRTDDPFVQLVSVDFAGGTVQQYIEAVQQAAGQQRVVCLANQPELIMPALSLRDVTLRSAIGAVEPCYFQGPGYVLDVDVTPSGDTIIVRSTKILKTPPESVKQRVWSISSIVESRIAQAPDVLAAVQAALAMQPESVPVSFHEDTGLMIASGTNDQLNLVGEVISTLKEDAKVRAVSNQAAEANLNAELQQMRTTQAELEKRLAETIEKLNQETALRQTLEARLALLGGGR